jgi:hypothetical protein
MKVGNDEQNGIRFALIYYRLSGISEIRSKITCIKVNALEISCGRLI